MDYLGKIKTKAALLEALAAERARERKIVHCHGCFDILHPGHVRHLAWAKEQGDVLVVTLSADEVVKKGLGRPFVPEALRAENLAAIGFVDYVAIDDGEWAGPILELLKPDIYIKGKEFENVFTGRIGRERELVQSYGGKVLFSSGDVVYSSTAIYEHERLPLGLPDERLRAFRHRNGLRLQAVHDIVARPECPPVLVVGDLLVSEDVFCVPTQRADEGLARTVKATGKEQRLAGAADVARALARLGAPTTLLAMVGDDQAGAFAREALAKECFAAELVTDPTRPTARRRRYLLKNAELFVAHEFKNHPPEPAVEVELLRALARLCGTARAAVVADYGAGAVGANVLADARTHGRMHGLPLIGLTAPLAGMTNVRTMVGFTVVATDEASLRQTFCDAGSGVADLGVLAANALKTRHFLLALPDGGNLLLSAADIAGAAGETSYELKARTPTEYLPYFGPRDEVASTPEHMLGPLAYFFARGIPFVPAAYLAFGAARALSDSRAAGAELGRAIATFLEEHSFLPDERDGLLPSARDKTRVRQVTA